MAADPDLALHEHRGLIGMEGATVTAVIDAERVALFRSVLREAEPGDEVVEQDTTVPLTFFCPDPIILAARMGLPRPRPYARNVDGGTEWQFSSPAQVGEVIALAGRIADISAKAGSERTGAMLVTVFEITARGQDGRLLGTARSTSLSYEGTAP